MNEPIVSVCMPTYNYGRFLKDSIESVLGQTFGDLELIITDDQSSDGSQELCERYAKLDPRVSYHRNEGRLGANGNLRSSAEKARGKYLKMLCSDDWLTPDCIQTFVDLFEEHPNVVVGSSAYIDTDEAGTPTFVDFFWGKDVSVVPGEEMLERMSKGEGFGGNSLLFYRRDAYERVGGYNAKTRYAGDYELCARLCTVGDYLHTDRPMAYGRTHGASVSSNDPKKLWDVHDFLELPAAVLNPRPLFSRNWRWEKRIRAIRTAQYASTAALSYLRGRKDYAKAVAELLVRQGSPLAIAYLPKDFANRISLKVFGSKTQRPEPWMGLPKHKILA